MAASKKYRRGDICDMILGIEHIGLVARDVDKLCDWYNKVFGFKTIRVLEDGSTFIEAQNGFKIEIYKLKEDDPEKHHNHVKGLRHIAIDVEDFEYEKQRLTDLGVEWANYEVYNENVKLALFYDIEGNLIHITRRTLPL